MARRKRMRAARRRVRRGFDARRIINIFVLLAVCGLIGFGLYSSPGGVNAMTGAATGVNSAGMTGTFMGLAIVAVALLLSYAHIKRNSA